MQIRFSIRTIFALLVTVSLVLIGCGGGGSSSTSVSDYSAEDSFSTDLSIQDHVQLRLEGISGDINIQGTSNDNAINISGIKRVTSRISTDDAEEQLQNFEISIQDLTDEIFINTIEPEQTDQRNYQVNYVIILPQHFLISVSNVNGKIMVDSINALVSVR